MKEQDLRDKFEDIEWVDKINLGDAGCTEYEFYIPKEQTDKCVQIAKDYAEQEAIEFAEWKDKNTYPHPFEENNYQFFSSHNDQTTYTLKQLYQLFKTKENER